MTQPSDRPRTPLPLATHPFFDHSKGFHGAFLWGDIPVLIRDYGRYPEAQLPDGRTTRDASHIVIGIGGGSINSSAYYSGYSVHVLGDVQPNGQRQSLKVIDASDYTQKNMTATAEPWLQKALEHLPAAANLLAEMSRIYTEASERISVLQRLPRIFESRASYEAACATAKVDALPDEDCST